MGEDVREDPTGGDRLDRRRLTVPDAATVLGVTVDAVRGRIRRGKLDSEHDKDGKVYVWIEAPEADRPGPSATGERPSSTGEGPAAASQGPSTEHAELVEALRDQLESQEDQICYLREQLDAERAANGETRRLLAGALERIPAIESPESRESSSDAAEHRSGTDTPEMENEPETAPQRRGWFRRFFGIE